MLGYIDFVCCMHGFGKGIQYVAGYSLFRNRYFLPKASTFVSLPSHGYSSRLPGISSHSHGASPRGVLPLLVAATPADVSPLDYVVFATLFLPPIPSQHEASQLERIFDQDHHFDISHRSVRLLPMLARSRGSLSRSTGHRICNFG